jgi:hypothetical protein
VYTYDTHIARQLCSVTFMDITHPEDERLHFQTHQFQGIVVDTITLDTNQTGISVKQLLSTAQ